MTLCQAQTQCVPAKARTRGEGVGTCPLPQRIGRQNSSVCQFRDSPRCRASAGKWSISTLGTLMKQRRVTKESRNMKSWSSLYRRLGSHSADLEHDIRASYRSLHLNAKRKCDHHGQMVGHQMPLFDPTLLLLPPIWGIPRLNRRSAPYRACLPTITLEERLFSAGKSKPVTDIVLPNAAEGSRPGGYPSVIY
jgi:hypothetical protein